MSLRRSLNSFTAQLDRFDCYFIAGAVEVRSLPLARKGVEETPAHDLVPLFIEQNHRAISPVNHSIQDVLMPVLQVGRFGNTSLESYVADLCQARQLSSYEVSTLAIFDAVYFSRQARDFAKAGVRDSININAKIEVLVRIYSFCHFRFTSGRSAFSDLS